MEIKKLTTYKDRQIPVVYYEIYMGPKSGNGEQWGNLYCFVEHEEVAIAICSNNPGFSYTQRVVLLNLKEVEVAK